MTHPSERGSILTWLHDEGDTSGLGYLSSSELGTASESRRKSPALVNLSGSSLTKSSSQNSLSGGGNGKLIQNSSSHESFLVKEIEALRDELRRRDQSFVNIESQALNDARKWETTQSALSLMEEKYKRLLESHRKLNKLNHDLEDKLLTMAQKWDTDRQELSDKMNDLIQRLGVAKVINGDLTAENDDYKAFFSQKFESLPTDIQESIRASARRDRLQNWPFIIPTTHNEADSTSSSFKKSRHSSRLPMATFPPTALMLPISSPLDDMDGSSRFFNEYESCPSDGADENLLEVVKVESNRTLAPDIQTAHSIGEYILNLILRNSPFDQNSPSSRCKTHWKLAYDSPVYSNHSGQVRLLLDEATQTDLTDASRVSNASLHDHQRHTRNTSCPDLANNLPTTHEEVLLKNQYDNNHEILASVDVFPSASQRTRSPYNGRLSGRSTANLKSSVPSRAPQALPSHIHQSSDHSCDSDPNNSTFPSIVHLSMPQSNIPPILSTMNATQQHSSYSYIPPTILQKAETTLKPDTIIRIV